MSLLKLILRIVLLLVIAVTVYYFYPEDKLSANSKIDYLLVYKSKRQLLAYSKGKILKTYVIALGRNPVGKKEYEGDKKTPEGIYFINGKNDKSGYYKNLGISYPNSEDIANARKLKKSTGGDVKIHGLKNGEGYIHKFHRWTDWTAGCIALTNDEVDELYNTVVLGTRIEIRP